MQTAMPFCDRLETRNLQSSPPPEGLVATQGINTTFGAFMTAVAELDYDDVFGGGDFDPADAVCFSLAPFLELDSSDFFSTLGRGSIVPSLGITRLQIRTTR